MFISCTNNGFTRKFTVFLCFRFEKLISGMYLGEIVRHILLKLAREGVIFEGNVPDRLKVKDGFPTYYLSEVDRLVAIKYLALSCPSDPENDPLSFILETQPIYTIAPSISFAKLFNLPNFQRRI